MTESATLTITTSGSPHSPKTTTVTSSYVVTYTVPGSSARTVTRTVTEAATCSTTAWPTHPAGGYGPGYDTSSWLYPTQSAYSESGSVPAKHGPGGNHWDEKKGGDEAN